jgi:hypothetical protein
MSVKGKYKSKSVTDDRERQKTCHWWLEKIEDPAIG